MVIGLQALEFTDCLLDSPEFRENLNRHEKELDKTSQQMKRIVKEIKDLLIAANNLSRAQRTLSKSLNEFNFECIGSTQTDDEQVIVDSLKQFGKLIATIEDERDNMLARAHDQIVVPLENFRKDHIGGVKENKKTFYKKTAKFCQAQERFLNISAKKPDNTVQEADAHLGMLEREYLRESLSYVLRIQEVQERIKFEFVETLLGFMSGWLVFYHLGHEVAEDAKEYMTDLQHKVQKTRENFDETRTKAEELKAKYMDSKMKPESEYTKQGYLFLMEKKAFSATWSKYYCTYKKEQKQFSMLQYNQISGRTETPPECLNLVSCTRRASEFEKRFCFDLAFDQKPGLIFTFQALSEEDRKAWLNAMDGKEPTYLAPGKSQRSDEYQLDEVGFTFIRKCIEILENRGLEEEGLYRIGGVSTKIIKLISMGMDRKKTEKERFQFLTEEQNSDLLESKTIASALKHYLRNLGEPLMTSRYHNGFIAAAKQDTRLQRINDVHTLMYRLPKTNFEMLEIVVRHLKAVSMKCHKNKMSVFNLGVVFGPTLLRAAEETVASILDIKFNNVVIEILIENYDLIFKSPPGKTSEYLSHSSPPEPIPRSHYRGRNSHGLYSQQPVVRVVAKSNYTEPVMSSSLQNIPNGLAVYQNNTNKSSSGKNHHPIYDTKQPSSMNQSTPSLIRDVKLSPRDLGMTRGGSGGGEPTYITVGNNHNSSTNHQPRGDSQHLLNSSQNTITTNATHQNHYGSKEKSLMHATRDMNLSRETNLSTLTTRSTGDGIYGPAQRLNPMTYSDSNLIQPREYSIIDRINSTSSSNESVCSSSSRDLNHTYSRRPTWDYNISIRDDASQNYSPKKTQRKHKEIGRHKYGSVTDHVRVRTLYACLAENDGELSFEPNQIITNVKPSNEPGWLEGTLNGKSGLIPENYVEVIP